MEANSTLLDRDVGSIIVILVTDAPLLPQQLKRLATRVSLCIGKLGGIGGDSSGDLFLAFSTATTTTPAYLPNEQIDLLFAATTQCVEEAVVNALVAAETMTGHKSVTVEAVSHEHLVRVLKKYNRLN